MELVLNCSHLFFIRVSTKPVGIKTRICSAHFITGSKSSKPEDVDYVPTIFPGLNEKPGGIIPNETEEVALTKRQPKKITRFDPGRYKSALQPDVSKQRRDLIVLDLTLPFNVVATQRPIRWTNPDK